MEIAIVADLRAAKAEKQIRFLNATRVPVTQHLTFASAPPLFRPLGGTPTAPQHAAVEIELTNSKSGNLGVPLPQGTVRVYQSDRQGALQFAGEDSIPHTATDEKVKVHVGEAFDLVSERKQTDFKVIEKSVWETAWEIVLRNHRDRDADVAVLETMSGDWEVLAASHKYTKADTGTLRFDVAIPKGGETHITYRVRMRAQG